MCDFTAGVRRAIKAIESVLCHVPTFDVDKERINVFELDECYVFKHYFELDEVFNTVREFYNQEEYRFEVPMNALQEVRDRLAENYFELEVVDDPERFCVAKRRYTDHPKLLFRNAVTVQSHGDYTIFLMKDELSVEQAIMHGAKPLSDTSLEIDF